MSLSAIQTERVFSFESPLQLKSGEYLGPIDITYQTMGTLSKNKDNVILLCHALTGNSEFSGTLENNKKGWWDGFIGPGKAIDTNRYFVICSNVLGGSEGSTGPKSKNPKTDSPYGKLFPVITIEDMVRCQHQLLCQLGIQKLRMVLGGSMGGMQAIEWAHQYPKMVESCVPIASTAQVSALAIAFDTVARHAIMNDPSYVNRSSETPCSGLSTARMLGHITYLSEILMRQKFGRDLQDKADYSYSMDYDFKVESYLHYQGNKFIKKFDPDSYLRLTKAVSYFDIANGFSSLSDALKDAESRFLVISITSDWLYTSEQSKELVHHLMQLNKDVSYIEIDSDYGHDSFLVDTKRLEQSLSVFLESLDAT